MSICHGYVTTKTTNSMIFTNNIEMREKWDKYVGEKNVTATGKRGRFKPGRINSICRGNNPPTLFCEIYKRFL